MRRGMGVEGDGKGGRERGQTEFLLPLPRGGRKEEEGWRRETLSLTLTLTYLEQKLDGRRKGQRTRHRRGG